MDKLSLSSQWQFSTILRILVLNFLIKFDPTIEFD
jgi:hypothetical protein